jgi:hypothetical protein
MRKVILMAGLLAAASSFLLCPRSTDAQGKALSWPISTATGAWTRGEQLLMSFRSATTSGKAFSRATMNTAAELRSQWEAR